MNSTIMKKLLTERLAAPEREINFDKDKDIFRIVNQTTGKGISIELAGIMAKWEVKKEKAIDEVVYYVEEALKVMGAEHALQGKEKQIFPVIRSTSFPTETEDGDVFLTDEHTAETRIYYALDLGTTYRLIDNSMLQKENWEEDHLREIARFNIRSLPTNVKSDIVAGNTFYFQSSKDGYDASRVLNEAWLKELQSSMKGTMTVAIPHQDVIIIGDIQNEVGYDVLAQMAMSFFASGHVPITALSFLYEGGELEPIFILGKNRKRP